MPDSPYPDDIDPVSGFRLPYPDRAALDEAGQRTYDRLADPKGGTIKGLHGPGGVLLYSPVLSRLGGPVNRYLREEAMTPYQREVAILTAAREADSRFEWAAHEPEALKAGVPAAVIEAIKHRRPTAGLPEADAAMIELGREAFGRKRVSPAVFARAHRAFGTRLLIDVISLMGNYVATAALLAMVDMQLDPDETCLLPVE